MYQRASLASEVPQPHFAVSKKLGKLVMCMLPISTCSPTLHTALNQDGRKHS